MKDFIYHFKRELMKHRFDYGVLVLSGILFLIILNALQGERLYQLISIFIFITFYIIWGTYHHIMDGSLHLKTVLEYILIGFTVFFLVKIILYP